MGGCSKQPAPEDLQTEAASVEGEALITIKSVGNIRLNKAFPIRVKLNGMQPNTELVVSLEGVAGIVPSVETLTVTTDKRGKAELRVSALVTLRDHSSLIVSTQTGDETVSRSLDIVFDSKRTRAAADEVGATTTEGKEIDIQAYYDSLPHTSDSNYVVAYEREKHGVSAIQGSDSFLSTASNVEEDNVPSTLIVDNITYLMPDGSESEPFSGIEYYLADTGSGEPTPDEVEGTDVGGSLSTQAACTTSRTYTQLVQTVDGAEKPVPNGTYIRIVDYNGVKADRIIEEYFVGANGYFWYDLPTCDTAGGSTKPDIYFILETRTQKLSNGQSVSDGLTASHGSITRRHWWRTGTYYDVDQNTRPNKIKVVGANSEAKNTQRLWYKVNQVRNWERSATGVSFPVDILYPVAEYLGVLGFDGDASRAALGQVQILYADAFNDPTIFHEFGHEVYYRKVMGESAYNSEHKCNLSGACSSFPLCGGCINHSRFDNIGPEAAMIEGWADFFAALTTRIFPDVGDSFQVELKSSSWKTGPGNEAHVAAFIWDMWDNPSNPDPLFNDNDGSVSGVPNDPVAPSGSYAARYKQVAGYFTKTSSSVNISLSSELKDHWFSGIKKSLSGQALANHCKILKFNTLGSIDTSCP